MMHKDKKNLLCFSLFLLSVCFSFFIIGYKYGTTGIVITKAHPKMDVYIDDNPMYGIPIVDFCSVLMALQNDNYSSAQKRTIDFLLAIDYDASVRMNICQNDHQRDELRTMITEIRSAVQSAIEKKEPAKGIVEKNDVIAVQEIKNELGIK